MKKVYSGIAGTIIAAIIAVAVAIYTPTDALEVQIKAPTSIPVGKIAVIDASQTGADSYAWSVSPASEALIFEDGQKLAFAHSVSGKYVFVIAAAKDGKIGMVEHIIEVTGGPAPGPDTLAARIKNWCSQVQTENKKAETEALSKSFSSVASIIAAGALSDPGEIVTATVEMNREALGGNETNWQPFFQGLREELNARAESGKLATKQDHIDTWRDISSVLKQYADTL